MREAHSTTRVRAVTNTHRQTGFRVAITPNVRLQNSNRARRAAEKVEGHKGLVATVERAIAAGQAGISEADVKTAAAKERLDRLARGEPVAGGFDKPMTIKDVIKATGWTASDVRRALLTYAISEAGGLTC